MMSEYVVVTDRKLYISRRLSSAQIYIPSSVAEQLEEWGWENGEQVEVGMVAVMRDSTIKHFTFTTTFTQTQRKLGSAVYYNNYLLIPAPILQSLMTEFDNADFEAVVVFLKNSTALITLIQH